MPTYQYQAYDSVGKAVNSSSSADSLRQLRRELTERGLFLIEAKEITEKTATRRWWQARLSVADSALLLRQLAILVNSGMPLEAALRLTAEQSDSAVQRQALESWREGLASGYSFAACLKRSPFPMSHRVIAAIEVGEETGHLHKILSRVADEVEQGSDNRQTLMKGMIYPAVMVVVALMVISVLMGYVVPQVAKVFVNSRQELPLLTQVTMSLSSFVRQWGIYLLLMITLVSVAFVMSLRIPENRFRWHKSVLQMPLVGKWIRMAALADWCQSLGSLLQSGVPVMSALNIAAAGVGNVYLQSCMEEVNEQVRQGNSLYQGLKRSGIAPGFLLHMVSSGEASSELDQMLLKVSDYYTNRLRSGTDTLLKLLEPALVVFMGVVVMLIVGAVLVPIVKMNQLI